MRHTRGLTLGTKKEKTKWKEGGQGIGNNTIIKLYGYSTLQKNTPIIPSNASRGGANE